MSSGFSLSNILQSLTSFDQGGKTLTNMMSGSLSTAWGILETSTPDSVYDLYKQQEAAVVSSATINAQRIRAKGEVELRNLEYAHAQAIGEDITKVAAGHGNLSGSTLDVLMQKEKFQMLDEATVQTNTETSAFEVMREGYMNAANYAMNAEIRAQGDAKAVAGAFVKGLGTYFSAEERDRLEATRQADLTKSQDAKQRRLVESMVSDYGLGYPGDPDMQEAYIDQTKTQMDTNSVNPKLRAGLLGGFETNLDNNAMGSGGVSWA